MAVRSPKRALAALLLLCAVSAGTPSPTSTSALLARISVATGAAAFARGGGLVVEEQSSGRPRRLLFGARGELRVGDLFGFDGDLRWHVDSRRGGFVPVNHRLFEQAAIPLWVRSGWWLDRKSGFAIAMLPALSDAHAIALRLTGPEGLASATLYIDRATSLPMRLVVPTDHGDQITTFSDYRRIFGIDLAFRVDEAGRAQGTTVSVRPMAAGDAGFEPPPLADFAFDRSVPADIPIRQGSPFSPGVPPHLFVKPEIDGAERGWFLFDSGADLGLIDAKVADAAGMKKLEPATLVGTDGNPRAGAMRKGATFRIGRLSFRDPLFLATDFSSSNAPLFEPRAGVIGYDVFARAIVEFVGHGERIAICDPRTYRLPAGGSWQKLFFLDSTPAVRARYGDKAPGRYGLFQIDTGSPTSVGFYPEAVAREHLLDGRPTRAIEARGGGGLFTTHAGRLGWFEFGGRRFEQLPAEFRTGGIGRSGGTGLIGRDLLSRFTTVFDYPNRRIGFVPLGVGPTPSGCSASGTAPPLP